MNVKIMLRCIRGELKKNFYLPYVLLPVISIICLCLMSEAETDYMGRGVSIFAIMLQGREAAAGNINRSALYLWKEGFGYWMTFYAPLLLSFGYIAVLSGERQSGQVQFALLRSGNFRYCTAKVVSGAFTGGVILAVSYALFGLLMAVWFPPFSSYPMEDQSFFLGLYTSSSATVFVIKHLVGAFLYGMCASAFGIGVAVVFRDKYMLLCLPFLLNYMIEQTLQKMALDQMAAGEDVSKWIYAFFPSSIATITFDKYWVTSIGVMLSVYAAIAALFYGNVKRGNYGG